MIVDSFVVGVAVFLLVWGISTSNWFLTALGSAFLAGEMVRLGEVLLIAKYGSRKFVVLEEEDDEEDDEEEDD